jgi:hypothetical protein
MGISGARLWTLGVGGSNDGISSSSKLQSDFLAAQSLGSQHQLLYVRRHPDTLG